MQRSHFSVNEDSERCVALDLLKTADRTSGLARITLAQFINRTRSKLVCITNSLGKDSIPIKSREQLTLLNENIGFPAKFQGISAKMNRKPVHSGLLLAHWRKLIQAIQLNTNFLLLDWPQAFDLG
jgi:hypothetical protein